MNLEASTSHAIKSLIAILVLALVHLSVKELRRLEARTRIALLSAGAGASLAYVLMRILPKLAEKQEDLMASVDTGLRGFLVHHAYLVAMMGFVVYYGISRVASYGAAGADSGSQPRYRAALLATIAGHAAYSTLIAYLIVNRLQMGLVSMGLIIVGMGTLFLVSDHGLRKKWTDVYDKWIRWVLSLALLGGWALGMWVEVSPNVIALWYAFLAGLMLITTVREKLSMEESGSFWSFLAGVVIFTVLLLGFESMP